MGTMVFIVLTVLWEPAVLEAPVPSARWEQDEEWEG